MYEGDTFVWKGMTELPTHEFDPFDSQRMDARDTFKGLRGGYCVAKLADGTWMIEKNSNGGNFRQRKKGNTKIKII